MNMRGTNAHIYIYILLSYYYYWTYGVLKCPFRVPFVSLCPALFRKILIKHGLHGGTTGERKGGETPAIEVPPLGQSKALLFLVAPEHRVRGYLLWESLESQVGTCPTLPKKPKILKAGTFSTLPPHQHHQAQQSHRLAPK